VTEQKPCFVNLSLPKALYYRQF